MPMSPDPAPRRPPIMPPGQAGDGFARPIAVPAAPTRTDAARATTPTISRLRWRIVLALQRPARPVELLLRDLAAGETPAQDVHRLVAAPRPAERPDRED